MFQFESLDPLRKIFTISVLLGSIFENKNVFRYAEFLAID
jgi:hypothetical protein